MAMRSELMLQRLLSSRGSNLLLPLVQRRSTIGIPSTQSRSIFILCKRSECAKAETGNCICKNMREAREKVQSTSKCAQIKTKKMIGKVGQWAQRLIFPKSWMEPLRVLEAGRAGKRRADPLGLFDGSSEKEQLEKAKKVFALIDYDHSGFVSEDELRRGLKEVFGIEAKEGQVERMMMEADENGDHRISLEEFLDVVSKYRSVEEDRQMRINAELEEADTARF